MQRACRPSRSHVRVVCRELDDHAPAALELSTNVLSCAVAVVVVVVVVACGAKYAGQKGARENTHEVRLELRRADSR